MHIPVLRDKIVESLLPLEGKVILDATVGMGGHAEPILPRIGSQGRLIGMDQDDQALETARVRLASFQNRLTLINSNFSKLQEVLKQIGVTYVDGIVMDLGLSTLQLEDQQRGFSFSLEGPLDMRMDRQQQLTARDIIVHYSEKDLGGLLREYGEERFARRIAAAIVHHRQRKSINTTLDLARLVEQAVPRKAWPKKIHPATRTFQALRIEVNHELEHLQEGLRQGAECLSPGGRFCVISYHSLEDRMVKFFFKGCEEKGSYRRVTKKPIVPDEKEISENRKSRSAKLRILERAA